MFTIVNVPIKSSLNSELSLLIEFVDSPVSALALSVTPTYNHNKVTSTLIYVWYPKIPLFFSNFSLAVDDLLSSLV